VSVGRFSQYFGTACHGQPREWLAKGILPHIAEARRLDDMRQNFKQFGLDSQTMTAIADLLQTMALAACLLLIAWIMSGMADAPLIAG
jgi:hypothetical protein